MSASKPNEVAKALLSDLRLEVKTSSLKDLGIPTWEPQEFPVRLTPQGQIEDSLNNYKTRKLLENFRGNFKTPALFWFGKDSKETSPKQGFIKEGKLWQQMADSEGRPYLEEYRLEEPCFITGDCPSSGLLDLCKPKEGTLFRDFPQIDFDIPEAYSRLSAGDGLRRAQSEAVGKANLPFSFVWGPPGTGKTFTIGKMIQAIVNANPRNRVLVTSTADKAVEGAMQSLKGSNVSYELLSDEEALPDTPHRSYDYVRQQVEDPTPGSRFFGMPQNKKREAILSARVSLADKRVIFTNSLRSIANKKIMGSFTHVIIDEASMLPMYMVKFLYDTFFRDFRQKMIFVGDPNQLPPVITNETLKDKRGFGMNIYDYLGGIENHCAPNKAVTLLNETSRMPAYLTKAVGRCWYSGKLESLRGPTDFHPLGMFSNSGPVVFGFTSFSPHLQYTPSEYSKKKTVFAEAKSAVSVANEAHAEGKSFLIISPYNAQVQLINGMLEENGLPREAHSVHRAQGAEADIVIFSTCYTPNRRGECYFNNPRNRTAQRLATVAFSRTKQQLFILGVDQQQQSIAAQFAGLLNSYPYDRWLAQQTPQELPAQPNTVVVPPVEKVQSSPASASSYPDDNCSVELLEIGNRAVDLAEERRNSRQETPNRFQLFDEFLLASEMNLLNELKTFVSNGGCTEKSNGRWTEPRLTAWFTKDKVSYTYSNITQDCLGWPGWLDRLADKVHSFTENYKKPNSMLLNVYRNGDDSCAMHQDNESLFDSEQPISSVSFGAVRKFEIGTSRDDVSWTFELPDNSLALMLPGFQDQYWHGVPKQPGLEEIRVNLTFRYIKEREYSGPTCVRHVKREHYDVYIGRAGKGQDGYFGNPIVKEETCPVCGNVHNDNENLVNCFRIYFNRRIQEDSEYARRVSKLRGLRLGCFCAPKRCHGEVFVEHLESTNKVSEITFSRSTDEYGAFGNMSTGFPLTTTDGTVWPTSEHLYQACKFQTETSPVVEATPQEQTQLKPQKPVRKDSWQEIMGGMKTSLGDDGWNNLWKAILEGNKSDG